jgi:hypothetical protein
MHATGGFSGFFALRHHFLAVNRKRLYNLCISREISPLRTPPTRVRLEEKRPRNRIFRVQNGKKFSTMCAKVCHNCRLRQERPEK